MPDDITRPAHYTFSQYEVHDVIEEWAYDNYNIGTALAYLARCGRKGTESDAIKDLRKAAWYIDKELKRRERVAPVSNTRTGWLARIRARARPQKG